MTDMVVKARIGAKWQAIIPKPVRDALGLKPGNEIAFVVRGGEVRLIPAAVEGNSRFACFTEWASEADRKGYADL